MMCFAGAGGRPPGSSGQTGLRGRIPPGAADPWNLNWVMPAEGERAMAKPHGARVGADPAPAGVPGGR